jgi:hypothetical protein
MSGFGDFFQGATQFAQTLSADFKEKKRKADERELLRKQLDFAALLDQQENNVRRQDFDETAYQNNQYYEDYQAWYDTQVDTMLKDVQDEELRERIEMSFRQMYQPSWNRVQATLENKADDKDNAETNDYLNRFSNGEYDPKMAAGLLTGILDVSRLSETDKQLAAVQYGTQAITEYAKLQAEKIAETEGVVAANAFIDSYSDEITIAGYSVTLGDVNKGKLKTFVSAWDQQRKDSEDTALDATYNSLQKNAWKKETGAYDPGIIQEMIDKLDAKDGSFNDPKMTRMWYDRLAAIRDNKGYDPYGGNKYGNPDAVDTFTTRAFINDESVEDYRRSLMEAGALISSDGFEHFMKLKQEQYGGVDNEFDVAEAFRFIEKAYAEKIKNAKENEKPALLEDEAALRRTIKEMKASGLYSGEALTTFANTAIQTKVKLDFTTKITKEILEGDVNQTENFIDVYWNGIAPLLYDKNGNLDSELYGRLSSIAGWEASTPETLKKRIDEFVGEMRSWSGKDLGKEFGSEDVYIDKGLHYPVGVVNGNKYIIRNVTGEEAQTIKAEYGIEPIKNHEAWYVWNKEKQSWIFYKSVGDNKANPAAVQEVSAINNPSGVEKYEEIEIGGLKPAEKIQTENKEAEITPAKKVEKQAAEEGEMELDGKILDRKETEKQIESIAVKIAGIPEWRRKAEYISYAQRPDFLDRVKTRVEELLEELEEAKE